MLGLDLLGLGSKAWNIAQTVQNWPKGWALGCFDTGWPHAFGDPFPNIRKILDTGNCPLIRIQAWWDPTHKICPLPNLVKRLPFYEALAKQYPNVQVYVSPSCEYHDGSVVKIKALVDAIKNKAPSCIPVLTPMQSPVIPGVIIERHGEKAISSPGGFASTDGTHLPDIDAENWVKQNKNGAVTFLWALRFNLAESGVKLNPDQRTAAPSGRYINAIVRLGTPKGAPPTQNFPGKLTPVVKPYLWKTFAEDMPGSQQRDNLPLLIVRGKAKEATIIDCNGKPLGKLKTFDAPGSYPGGLTRYYAGLPGAINLYGAELADKAQKQSGSEYVGFQVDNTLYGFVHAAFRQGFWHS